VHNLRTLKGPTHTLRDRALIFQENRSATVEAANASGLILDSSSANGRLDLSLFPPIHLSRVGLNPVYDNAVGFDLYLAWRRAPA